ncbi:MAG TPA: SDR family NAD(P)-dependent oxidoreductase, partial [Jatrophihabitans sp.]|nr:SDR family NAD(P)-dependent oxidoreductase [Jatrophihabitans sp.]
METELAGRVALVTGGSGGIGRAISDRLLAAGARVVVHYSSSPQPAHHVVERARGTGQALAIQADLADPLACEQLVSETERSLGPVDVLVVNHGRSVRRMSLEEVSPAEWDKTMAVNARAAFLLARRVVPVMQKRRFGRVLFTSSVAAFTGGVVGPDYAASKAALHGLVHYLAARAAADGVTVNAIAPALIEQTGMLPGDPGELAARVPVRRLGQPDEIADFALAVLRNGYITDHVL